MKLTIRELRNFIKSTISTINADREQLQFIGHKPELGTPDEEIEYQQKDPIDDPGKIVINDPYVKDDQPAPSVGSRKFGRT